MMKAPNDQQKEEAGRSLYQEKKEAEIYLAQDPLKQELKQKKGRGLISRRDFLWKSPAALAAAAAFGLTAAAGCKGRAGGGGGDSSLVGGGQPHSKLGEQAGPAEPDPGSWWYKDGFIVHEAVDTRRLAAEGIILARVGGSWREFKVIELPERFVAWSLRARLERLSRMLEFGGIDPRDLAGSHNACVATYGGPCRDSSISLNTAYKGMGFVVKAPKLAEAVHQIIEARLKIERDTAGDPAREIQAKVRFLAEFYHENAANFDRTKQVSLEIFTSVDFQTHTFLNMMVNPIASASFLAFPTFEIRAVPQLLHPKNPQLSSLEKDLVSYTNAIHDFIHSHGDSQRMVCVYHVIEVFDDTPNELSRGRRIA